MTPENTGNASEENANFNINKEADRVAEDYLIEQYKVFQNQLFELNSDCDVFEACRLAKEANQVAWLLAGQDAEPYCFHVFLDTNNKVKIIRGARVDLDKIDINDNIDEEDDDYYTGY